MLPVLVLFGRPVPAYGAAAMAGIVLAVLFYKWSEHRRGPTSGDTELAFLWGGIGALLGAKLLSLLLRLPDLWADLPLLLRVPALFGERYLLGGFVFYGGLAGALLGAKLYSRWSRVPFSRLTRDLVPCLPLVHAFGRVGCFCAGCCYGRPAFTPFAGVIFPPFSIAPAGIPLIPVQLYEAGTELALFFLLLRLNQRGWNGTDQLGVYLTGCGAVRFLLEFLRGDPERGWIGPVSLAQAASLLALWAGLRLLSARRRISSAPQ